MPRIVRHEATGPIKIDPTQWPRDEKGNHKTIWICACGLSPKFPFCDGTHKACKDEEPGVDYTYAAGVRTPSQQSHGCGPAGTPDTTG